MCSPDLISNTDTLTIIGRIAEATLNRKELASLVRHLKAISSLQQLKNTFNCLL